MGFLDELKDKAEGVRRQGKAGIRDRQGQDRGGHRERQGLSEGDDETPTLADEPVGYSGEGVEGIMESPERQPPGRPSPPDCGR